MFSGYTIKEVADRAKVSTATASRILSGKAGHRAGTVQRVQKVAAKLEAESSVRRNDTPDCIGILLFAYFDFLNTSYNATLVTSIVESLTAENTTVQLLVLTENRFDIAYIRNMVIEHNLKGLIVPEFDMLYAISDQLSELGIPVIRIGNLGYNAEKGSIVCTDNYQAGCDSTNYFWSFGHRSFGIICMKRLDVCQNERVNGFCNTIEKLGGDPGKVWVREYLHLSESLASAATELSNMGGKRPTAILSTNSLMTRKLLMELNQIGISVPEYLSIISFEEDRELEHMIPPVTVMAQPTRMMGELAVNKLFKELRGFTTAVEDKLRCSLIVRNSVVKLKLN